MPGSFPLCSELLHDELWEDSRINFPTFIVAVEPFDMETAGSYNVL